MAKTFGWMLSSRYEHKLGEQGQQVHGMSVSLIRPYFANIDLRNNPDLNELFGGKGIDYNGTNAVYDFDHLLFPWQWEPIKWHLYDGDGIRWPNNKDVKTSQSGLPVVNQNDAKLARKSFRTYISAETRDTKSAFSAHIDDAEEINNKSLVHALAPLSRESAVISNGILKFGYILHITKDINILPDKLIAFPVFTYIKNGVPYQYSPMDRPFPIGNGDSLYACNYFASQGFPDDVEKIVFIAEAVEIIHETEGEFQNNFQILNYAEDKETVLRQRENARKAIVVELNPIATVIQYIQQEEQEGDYSASGINYNKAWAEMLLNTLGKGWLLDEDERDAYINHVFHTYLLEQELKDIFSTDLKTVFIPKKWILAQFKGKYLDIIKSEFSNDESPLGTEASFWKNFVKCVDINPVKYKAKSVEENNRLIDTWLEVARVMIEPEQLTRTHANWLQLLAYERMESLFENDKTNEVENLNNLIEKLGEYATEKQASSCVLAAFNYTTEADIEEYICELFPLSDDGKSSKLEDWLKRNLKILGLAEDITIDPENGDSPTLVSALISQHKESIKESSKPLPIARDGGILLRMECYEKTGEDDSDNDLRGYAIGLGSKLEWVDTSIHKLPVESGWLSSAASVVTNKIQGTSNALEPLVMRWSRDSNLPALCPIAIGSALSDGRRVTKVVYDGQPLCAAEGTAKYINNCLKHEQWLDSDIDFKDERVGALDYAWYNNFKHNTKRFGLPVMAYGLNYYATQTAIANSGVIDDPNRRAVGYDAQLGQLPELGSEDDGSDIDRDWVAQGQYLAFEAVGAPDLSHIKSLRSDKLLSINESYAITKETKAAQYLSKHGDNSSSGAKIGFLIPKENNSIWLDNCPDTHELIIRPPIASPSFIKRWLNTETIIAEADKRTLHSDEIFKKYSDDVINKLNDTILAEYKKLEGNGDDKTISLPWRYHPAVQNMAITVTWNGIEDSSETRYLPLESLVDSQDGLVVNEHTEYTVKIVSGNRPPNVNTESRSIDIEIPPGEFIRIQTYSLVKKELFENSQGKGLARFSNVLVEAGSEMTIEGTDDTVYIAFGKVDAWFECAPEWNNSYHNFGDSSLSIKLPDKENLQTCHLLFDEINKNAFDATWLNEIEIERHQWHWAGHPTRFSDDENTLINNIHNFSSVGSYRGKKSVVLSSMIADNMDWRIQPGQIVDTLSRGDAAPSDFIAYTARPIVRFRSWLNPDNNGSPVNLEHRLIATGRLLPGTVPIHRLETLSPRWVVPMTESYSEQTETSDVLPVRGPNGNLLVFDHAFNRTDERSSNSGIGEVIEVEVLNVRPFPSKNNPQVFKEMGPNPVFHPAPMKEDSCSSFDIETSRPFGLTYDIGENPKVVQTAISVFPKGTEGKWFMAKIRTRRTLLPESLIDYPSDHWPHGSNTMEFDLRLEGEDWVPDDIAIDFTRTAIPKKIKIDGKELSVPEKVKGMTAQSDSSNQASHRLRVTWHKDRWGEAGPPHWRPQVDLQEKVKGYLEWNTTETCSPYHENNSKVKWEHETGQQQFKVKCCTISTSTGVPERPIGLRILKLHISDYSDAQWISFIGMFDSENLGRSDEYTLTQDSNDKSKLFLKGSYLPKLQNIITCLDNDESPVFHILNVYTPTRSILNAKDSETSGRYFGSFIPEKENEFVSIDSSESDIPEGSFAYLYSFQRISSLSNYSSEKEEFENIAKSWANLLAAVFPEIQEQSGLNQNEALVRPLPQYLGPIKIINREN